MLKGGLALPILLVLAAAQQNTGMPMVAGFRLGDAWDDVGGPQMQCRSSDSLGADEEWARLWLGPEVVRHLKICEPADTASLWFVRDTLVHLVVTIAVTRQSTLTHWSQIEVWLATTFGAPDELVMTVGRDVISGYWDRSDSRIWRLEVRLSADRQGRSGGFLQHSDCSRVPCEPRG